MTTHTEARARIAWKWSDALYGFVCAVPAAVVALHDVTHALAFAFGVLPAVIAGIAPRRKARVALIVVGTLMGLSIFIGSLLASLPWLAVASLPVLAVGAAHLAERRPQIGTLAMNLALPLVGVGFSYTDRATTGGLAILLILGSAYACVVSMLWPQHPAPVRPAADVPSLMGYGVRLGLAGGTAAAIGFALNWDHVGWACAACMLVMRPAPDLVKARGVARALAVVAGASAGVVMAQFTSDGAAYAVAIVVVLVAASATHTSRWYITSAFTTFLVLSLLAYRTTVEDATGRLNERVAETVLGVGLAIIFGTVIPLLTSKQPANRP